MNFPTQSTATVADLQERHRTGSPVTVLPMTRRWISDVPSKIVKISAALFRPLVSRVCPAKSTYGSAVLGHRRTDSAAGGRKLLPNCTHGSTPLPADSHLIDPADLTWPQRAGEACVSCHKRYPLPRVFVGQLPDGTPVFACDECA